MIYDTRTFRNMLRWRFILKAFETFDQKTRTIVLSCWLIALLALFLALYTVGAAVEAKRMLASASVGEPALPILVTKTLTPDEIKPVAERLQKLFPGITAQTGKNATLVITAGNSALFRDWLISMGYLETLVPQSRWRIIEFCVGGACGGSSLMKAVLTVEKNSFVAPQ